MRFVQLGTSGLVVSTVGLGARNFGEGVEEAECMRIVDAYERAGGNLIDTAVTYADGRSEKILGRVLSGARRERFVLASKYGVRRRPDDVNSAGGSVRNLRLSLDASLHRLGTDYLDILWLHAWYPALLAEEFLDAVHREVQRGRVLYVGISNAPAWWTALVSTKARERHLNYVAAIQIEYSLARREPEVDQFPMAGALGLGVVAYSPLGRGSLLRGDSAGVSAQVGRAVSDAAAVTGLPPAAVAVHWLIEHGAVPLLGVRTASQLQQVVATSGPLPPDCVASLDAATAPVLSTQEHNLRAARPRVDPTIQSSETRMEEK